MYDFLMILFDILLFKDPDPGFFPDSNTCPKWSFTPVFHFSQLDQGSKKSAKVMENLHINQPKSQDYHTFKKKY